MLSNNQAFSEQASSEIKACCAALYEGDWATLLLGQSLHPGGVALTEQLGRALQLQQTSHVLDVASGNGTSALHLTQCFGCRVMGVDFSEVNVARAHERSVSLNARGGADFLRGDSEQIPIRDGAMDAVISECAFCTFPDKPAAAAEFARVLRPGGKVGLTDVYTTGPLPAPLQTLLAHAACIADARPVDDYVSVLTQAGLHVTVTEDHSDVLTTLVKEIGLKLMAGEILTKMTTSLPISREELAQGQSMARSALDAVASGVLGYALIIAVKE